MTVKPQVLNKSLSPLKQAKNVSLLPLTSKAELKTALVSQVGKISSVIINSLTYIILRTEVADGGRVLSKNLQDALLTLTQYFLLECRRDCTACPRRHHVTV